MAKFLIVVAIVFVLALAPRIWRMRKLADQRDQQGFADLPVGLQGTNPTFVIFTTRFCRQCAAVERALRSRAGAAVHVIDVEDEPQLAATYRVKRAPTVIEADAGGRVRRRLVGVEWLRAEAVAS